MTRELMERCEWGDTVAEAADGVEAFLETGLGLCLIDGDEIVCEAYAPFLGRRSAEVGVVTPEAYRVRGLAAIAVAFLAERLAGQGLGLYWSCDAENTASIRVAEKLGFVGARRYAMLLYRQLPST
jgi:predicted GNAT family acetyltransferase